MVMYRSLDSAPFGWQAQAIDAEGLRRLLGLNHGCAASLWAGPMLDVGTKGNAHATERAIDAVGQCLHA
jgi:hypothetical protein